VERGNRDEEWKMRPRDIINRRKNFYLLIVAISFGVFAIVAFTEKYLPETWGKAISYGAGIVFLTGVLLVYFGIKCPKCNKTLGLNFVFAEEKLARCPRCKIHFDEDSL
jgi:hypothetical protein